MDKDDVAKIAKQVFIPAGYDTIFTKFRLAFFIGGIILVLMGFSSSTYLWLGIICLFVFTLMVAGSISARKSMAQKLSQNR